MAKVKVFIIDDSHVFRSLIKKMLQDENYQVIAEAHNGLDVLDIYRNISVDIVIVDIKMSGMDGFKLIPEILKINPSQKILAVTTDNKKEDLEKIKELGALDALRKPFQPAFLFTRLEKIISIKTEILNESSHPSTVENEEIINIQNSDSTESIEENIENEDKVIEQIKKPEIVLIKKEEPLLNENSWEEDDGFIISIPSSQEENKEIIQIVNANDNIVFSKEYECEVEKQNEEIIAVLKEEVTLKDDETSVETDDNQAILTINIAKDSQEDSKKHLERVTIRVPDRMKIVEEDKDLEELEAPDLSVFLNDDSNIKTKNGSMLSKIKTMFKK